MEGLLLSTIYFLDTSRTSTEGGEEEPEENSLLLVRHIPIVRDAQNTSRGTRGFKSYSHIE